MSNYIPEKYWDETPFVLYPAHKEQEEQLIQHLETIGEFRTVLEVGCGTGRIAKLLSKNFAIDTYHGVDISAKRISQARREIDKYGFHFFQNSIQDIKYMSASKFDLVIAIECLMHIRPVDIKLVIDKMVSLAGHNMITLDYFPDLRLAQQQLQPHNFLHDYPSLLPANTYPERISDYQVIFNYERKL